MIGGLCHLHKKMFVSVCRAVLSQSWDSVVAVLVYLTAEIVALKEARKVPAKIPTNLFLTRLTVQLNAMQGIADIV